MPKIVSILEDAYCHYSHFEYIEKLFAGTSFSEGDPVSLWPTHPAHVHRTSVNEHRPRLSAEEGVLFLGVAWLPCSVFPKKKSRGQVSEFVTWCLCQRALIRRLPSVVGLIARSCSRRFHVHGDDSRMNSLAQTSLQGVVSLQRQTPA